MGTRIDLTGQRFGRLVVVGEAGRSNGGQILWRCFCDCGAEKVVQSAHLRNGSIKSCGCLRDEVTGAKNRTHGKTKSHLYAVWSGMKDRCYRKENKKYSDYGGRGIRLCNEWKNDFQKFYDWAINNGYKEGLTIDRIDVNGNYCPENCRWATWEQQKRNKRNSCVVTYRGETRHLKEWADVLEINYYVLHYRLFKGNWTVEEAFETPAGQRRKK